MGKFIPTKFSDHQHRVVKKRPGKSIVRCLPEKVLPKKAKTLSDEQNRKPEGLSSWSPDPNSGRLLEKVEDGLNSDYQDLRLEVAFNQTGGKYLKLVKPDCDLFAVDELKARYDQYTKYNLIFIIFDEIALEGLDGITIEALWKRIQHTMKLEIMPEHLKGIIWSIIFNNEKIKLFELPEARPELRIVNMDTDILNYAGGDPSSVDIYKFEQATKDSGEWGSCTTLSTRVDISDQVRKKSLDEVVATYGNKLVLVADEDLRKSALFGDIMDPNYEFSQIEYCVLERIGRARDAGETTLGPTALSSSFRIDRRSLYHYCKRLNKEYLVTRQYCFLSSLTDQTKVGRLFHLRRFYFKRKSKYALIIENIINYLKKCPGFRAPYTAVRALIDHSICGKFFKNQDMNKYFDANIFIPYKEYYPDATYRQYMTKSLNKERVVQLMQLKDPYVNITACWNEGQSADSSDDEEDEGDSETNRGRRIYNKDIIRDIYQYILSTGTQGVKTPDLAKVFDIDFPMLRNVLKKLSVRQLIFPKKCDFGRQTVNMFIATCLLDNQDRQVSQPKPVHIRSSSTLEKLRQRQKRKIDSLNEKRVYKIEQIEADQGEQLLALETCKLLPITIQLPEIICDYFIPRDINVPASVDEMNPFVVRLKGIPEPFTFKLGLPRHPDNITWNLTNISLENNELNIEINKSVKEFLGELSTDKFKPDYFSKAFLFRAFLDKLKLSDTEIIDFLDPDRNSRQAEKRPLEYDVEHERKKSTNGTPCDQSKSGVYMGSNPILVMTEVDEESGFVMEIHVSTPIREFKTGDISYYVDDLASASTERVLYRINLILRTIQQQHVFEEVNRLLKLIVTEESAAGYRTKMDRRSLHKLLGRLANEGYIKMFAVIFAKEEMRRVQTYVCHPQVSLTTNHILQESISRVKEKVFYMVKDETKTNQKSIVSKSKRSPFIEDDVLKSLNEIKQLTSKTSLLKTIKKAGKLYGRRPKFARLPLLHELLFYLIYDYNKDKKPLSKFEVASLFQEYEIKLTRTDLDKLPQVYCKEISWKTFIPPMPHHHGWGKGWALLVDVLLRMPITLITQCLSVTSISPELQEILQHPIKRFYLLRHMSPSIRNAIMFRRKIIHDIYGQLLLLCYCGLIQFGPSSFHYREKSFFYLNRKATLWDTTSSAPGYLIIEEKEYPELHFQFDTIEDVLNYWSSMKEICTRTNLNTRSLMEGKTITLVDPSAKPSLNKVRAVKTQNRTIQCDTGELPGDHKGAAGLDSTLCSHLARNWYIFARRKVASTDFLEALRLDQVANKKVAFDELKLSASTHKYYIAKPQETKLPSNPRQIKPSKTGKKVPVIKRTVPVRKRKLPSEKKDKLDAVDRNTIRKVSTLRHRPNWSEEEDRLLILLKIASRFITPGTTKQIISYAVFRDFMHIVEPKSRDKTTRSMSNRLKILRKSVPILSNIEDLIPNLFKLVPIAKYFLPFRTYVIHGTDHSGMNRKFKVSDAELTNAFLFIAYYFFTHRKEVEVSLHGRNISTDYFSEENLDFFKEKIEPFDQKIRFYSDPESESDIRKYVLKNTVHSALAHKNDRPTWSLKMYKIYQQYSEDVLKSVLQEMRSQRMIQFIKYKSTNTLASPFRLSLYYIIGQCCIFSPHTVEEAYQIFLDLKYNPNEIDYTYESVDERKYGQLFALNEILTVMLNNATFHFKIPEHHLVLNPLVEDHSEVIDELAKRYQAKLKNDQKETDSQSDLQSSSKTEDEISDAVEPEAGPSSDRTNKDSEFEIITFEEDEPLDLSITAKNSTTIDNLKHWISDCIDAERVRSPSPELLHLEVSQEPKEQDVAEEVNKSAPAKEREDRVLTLEEIKEEMLKINTPNEKRLVPYISDLTKLLSVSFEEIESDEQANYLMRRHFVQQYPSVEKIEINELGHHYLADFLENRTSIKDIWIRVEREAQVSAPNNQGLAFEQIFEKGGTIEDVELACELLSYIKDKGIHGAAGYKIKEKFSCYGRNCSLEFILRVLMDNSIIMRTGVCTIVFVHHQYRDTWLSDNFMLTQESSTLFPDKAATSEYLTKLEAGVDGVDISRWVKINPLPWTTLDGILNKDLFKMWLSQVFSYCVENPMAPLTSVFDKFCYLKPVDVFYLVEVLEDIGALEMRHISVKPVTLFSEYECTDENKATFLDQFEEICVEPSNIGFTILGSFFHSL